MKTDVLVAGEILAEIIRPEPDQSLDTPGLFEGPLPGGAPAIVADAVSRLGHPAVFLGAVGDDRFGQFLKRRLEADGVDCRHLQIIPHASTATAFVAYHRDRSREFLFHLQQSAAAQAFAYQLDDSELESV